MTTTLLTAIKNNGRTENGCITHISTLDKCLDFFFTCGAMRYADDSDIITAFLSAYNENPLTALKILFYSRDIRGGQGERKLARICLKALAEIDSRMAIKVVSAIPIYGRWDDLFSLFETKAERAVLDLIKEIKPKYTILTNLHSTLDYDKLKRKLPNFVYPAYDGMKLIIN